MIETSAPQFNAIGFGFGSLEPSSLFRISDFGLRISGSIRNRVAQTALENRMITVRAETRWAARAGS